MTARGSAIRLAGSVPAGLLLVACLLYPGPAGADGTIVIGTVRPAVTVNREVIESLPAVPVLPAPLLNPSDTGAEDVPGEQASEPGLPPIPGAEDALGEPGLPPIPVLARPRSNPTLVFTRRGTDDTRVLPPPAIPAGLLSTLSQDSLLPDTVNAPAAPPVLPEPVLRPKVEKPVAGGETTAARTTPSTREESLAVRIEFAVGSALLPDDGPETLERLVPVLGANATSRVLVAAYASAPDDSRVKARRLSLSRALAVRSHLISQGIDGLRIDVQARGNAASGGPADRVDVAVLEQRQ
ncbi:MAG: OmpA family protein [Alphaproteobacteria bacterium]|nr:OmpA family protein [Alphaproteobacteria bacterium]